MKRLQDNVTIITGGGKGIGFGLASAFAKEGSNLVITGRNEARLLEAKKKLEEGYGVKVLALVADGADEIDVVLPYKAFMDGDKEAAAALLKATREACKGKVMKVIIESGVLAHAALIADASRLSIECGADFIKTSTGKTAVSATLEAANAMLEVIRESGKPVGFKASGGVRTTEQAADYLTLADKIMGPKWANTKTFRFGASGLRDSLLASMGYETAPAENKGY